MHVKFLYHVGIQVGSRVFVQRKFRNVLGTGIFFYSVLCYVFSLACADLYIPQCAIREKLSLRLDTGSVWNLTFLQVGYKWDISADKISYILQHKMYIRSYDCLRKTRWRGQRQAVSYAGNLDRVDRQCWHRFCRSFHHTDILAALALRSRVEYLQARIRLVFLCMMVKNAKSNVLVPVVLFQMQANALKIAPSDAPKLDLTKAGGSSGPCLKILHSKFPVGQSPGCTAADALAAKGMYILYFLCSFRLWIMWPGKFSR